MKTVIDVWLLIPGDYQLTFKKKEEAIKLLADQAFLEQFPDNVIFTLQPGYQIVDFEVPGLEYYDPDSDKPKLITKV